MQTTNEPQASSQSAVEIEPKLRRELQRLADYHEVTFNQMITRALLYYIDEGHDDDENKNLIGLLRGTRKTHRMPLAAAAT